jgi:hypothetical protein
MGDTETLSSLLDSGRKKLSEALATSTGTKRPVNVCAGHDPLYMLLLATAGGVDTNLAVTAGVVDSVHKLSLEVGKLSERLRIEAAAKPLTVSSSGEAARGWAAMMPIVGSFVLANGKAIVGWVFITLIVLILRGDLKAVLDALPRRQSASAVAPCSDSYN